ncbi:S8 family serine peptidase [Taklimakanibacter deserti]|uniref:S8 family serine peptidase n=1 Tax=Taklimakanibacter deserti TaxID=2267839 RepID=UPI000E646647
MQYNKSDSSFQVEVRNATGDIVKDATVTLQSVGSRNAISVPFDDKAGLYVANEIPRGDGVLDVRHSQLQSQTRKIHVGGDQHRELFILGAKGVKTYFREKVRVPVDADGDLIGVTLVRRARGARDAVIQLTARLGLQPEDVPPLAEKAGVQLFRSGGIDAFRALAQLSEHPLVEHAGAVVSMRQAGFTHLTREIVVQLREQKDIRPIAEEHGYEVVRELSFAPRTYVLRWNKPATLDILDSIAAIAARDDVEWAEPSLVVTPEVDAIIPTDPLWPGLWDRQLITVQDAWQHLQDAGLETFGDPDIILAVWDSGVQSVGGVPTNSDFSGTVSNGAPKVFATFDFDNMVANNDNPWDDHGSGVAGVSVALANNPSPIPGQAHGLAGSAPNVQIMTIAGRTPYIDLEVADQYIWMAGFDPQSPLAGFPAAPPARGADVITCSLTPGAGAPLSGTARATLDFVTTFGRGGKGTMCFFSTGNQNQNNVTARPYGAYEKCFGIAGTSFANDGVTEIRAPFSGWGQIALCSPTQDQSPTVHNPPTGFMPWSAAHQGDGNLISYVQSQTTLTAASAVGATSLTVASVAGFAVNAVIHVGPFGGLGSEPARITAVNAMTNQLTVQGFNNGFGGGLLNAHVVGDMVVTGPNNHRNNFGGTSSATPLCAGAAALVLSANPALTYIEARQILRDTAVKFDLANTDPVGQWLDANGNPSVGSGQPPVRSGWYGYGRVNAGAAVDAAIMFAGTRDLVLRDNLADTGAVASTGAFWNSPDIWCRRLDPAVDPSPLPPNYATAGPHEVPMRGQDNWVYARVRNNGTLASLDAWVRISVTHYPGMEFTYPASFQPINGPGDPVPFPMVPGTYFIAEAKITAVPPGGEQIINVRWPTALIPPADVATPSGPVHWHPCLLAEVTPHDGPPPTGNHVWDDNNLAQKNISIIGTDAGADFTVATVVGNEENKAEYVLVEINRGHLPREVELYLDLLDPILRRRIRESLSAGARERARLEEALADSSDRSVSALAGNLRPMPPKPQQQDWRFAWYKGREVVSLRARPRVQVPVYGGQGRLSTIVLGGVVGKSAKPGDYEIVLVQRQPSGKISGSATVALTIAKPSLDRMG